MEEITRNGENLTVRASGSKGEIICEADIVLLATGRRPYIGGLNPEAAGIEADGYAIRTDENFRTSADNIFAVGDVNGKIMLAHAAEH